MSRKEPKTLRVACFNDGRRKIITFKRRAYWWSPYEGAYPLSAALESIKHQGGWSSLCFRIYIRLDPYHVRSMSSHLQAALCAAAAAG